MFFVWARIVGSPIVCYNKGSSLVPACIVTTSMKHVTVEE